jgi:hypothetical protein
MTVTTKHMLLTGSWKTDVEALETAIGRFTADRPLTSDCQVVFFEIASDGHLHVNVTHKHQTMAVKDGPDQRVCLLNREECEPEQDKAAQPRSP